MTNDRRMGAAALFCAWALLGASPALAAAAARTEAGQVAQTDEVKQTKKSKAKRIKIIKRGTRGPRPRWSGFSKSPRGFLGVQLIEITAELRRHFGAPEDAGVLIARVEQESPAAAAGLQVGDVLVEVDDHAVDSAWDVARRVGRKKQDEPCALEVVRAGAVKKLSAKIEVREKPQVEVSRFIRRLPGDDNEIEIEVDTAPLEESIERMHEHLGALEEEEVVELQDSERDLEQRLEELERKLERLERGVERKDD